MKKYKKGGVWPFRGAGDLQKGGFKSSAHYVRYGKTKNEVNEKLKSDFELVTIWFHEKRMLLKPPKCK